MLWALACALLLQGGDRGIDGLGYAEIEAATAIGELGYEPGADALRSLQADLDPLVREAAARALQKLEKR